MTPEHLKALLEAADSKESAEGWHQLPEGRGLTLYVASNGAHLTVNRVEAVRRQSELLHARTVKGETFILALGDVFAVAVEGRAATNRKAGFV
jgi:hypothetical protein